MNPNEILQDIYERAAATLATSVIEVTRQLSEKRPVSRSEAIQASREAGVGLYPPEKL